MSENQPEFINWLGQHQKHLLAVYLGETHRYFYSLLTQKPQELFLLFPKGDSRHLRFNSCNKQSPLTRENIQEQDNKTHSYRNRMKTWKKPLGSKHCPNDCRLPLRKSELEYTALITTCRSNRNGKMQILLPAREVI